MLPAFALYCVDQPSLSFLCRNSEEKYKHKSYSDVSQINEYVGRLSA